MSTAREAPLTAGSDPVDNARYRTACPTCGAAGEVMIYLPEPTRAQWLTGRGAKRRAVIEPCGHEVPVPRRWLNRRP